MWLGQLACEGFNGALKNLFKEERPDGADFVSSPPRLEHVTAKQKSRREIGIRLWLAVFTFSVYGAFFRTQSSEYVPTSCRRVISHRF